MIKRYIDFRIVVEKDPSDTNNKIYILEVKHQFLFISYWVPVLVDIDAKNVMTKYRRLKKKHERK